MKQRNRRLVATLGMATAIGGVALLQVGCVDDAQDGARVGEEADEVVDAEQASTGGALDGNATTASIDCSVLRDLNPWTFVSVSCRRTGVSLPRLYAASITCIDHRINVEYTNVGTIFQTPTLGGWGPTSTARCDAGDHAIAGGRI